MNNTIEISLRYGLSKRLDNIAVPENTTIRQILSNTTYRSLLGLPESVSAVVDGVTLGLDDSVNDGDVVVFEKQAAAKAA